LEYFIDIYEYDFETATWKPFLTDDIQIEFTTLNPYYRLQMKMMNKPTYSVSFKAPDRCGVFKFIIEYRRVGYSYLDVSTKVRIK
jgi:oligosaccharyltransferase complex subunit beta